MVERHHPVHEVSGSRIRRISFGNAEFDRLIEIATTTSHRCLVSRGYEHNQSTTRNRCTVLGIALCGCATQPSLFYSGVRRRCPRTILPWYSRLDFAARFIRHLRLGHVSRRAVHVGLGSEFTVSVHSVDSDTMSTFMLSSEDRSIPPMMAILTNPMFTQPCIRVDWRTGESRASCSH